MHDPAATRLLRQVIARFAHDHVIINVFEHECEYECEHLIFLSLAVQFTALVEREENPKKRLWN